MPLFMDRHEIDGVTPEMLAEAHAKDLAVQHKHGTKYLNYWHDQTRGCVFCLVDAPSKEAAAQVHREAHGLVAEEIIEVDPGTVKAFFGDLHETPAHLKITPFVTDEPDTAFRAIMFSDLVGSTASTQELGDVRALERMRLHDRIVRDQFKAHSGREVKHTGDGFMVCFTSVARAVECAMAILRAFDAHNDADPANAMQLRIGLSAGEPVADDDDLFGATVQLAARLCALAEPGQIMVASVVRELCLGKKLPFRFHGDYALKGFDAPVQVYAVEWPQHAPIEKPPILAELAEQ